MVEVKFSKYEIEAARKLAETRYASKTGLQSTIAGTKAHDLKGILGEQAVKKYFQVIGLWYEESREGYSKHQRDMYDLLIFAGSNKRVDVKASSKWRGIAMNGRQRRLAFDKRTDILMGVYFPSPDLSSAEIVGFAYPHDLERDTSKDFIYKDQHIEMYSVPEDKIRQFKQNDVVVPEIWPVVDNPLQSVKR